MITEEDKENEEQPFDAKKDLTMELTDKIKLGKEVALATPLTDTGTISENVTLSGTDQYNLTAGTQYGGSFNNISSITANRPQNSFTNWQVFFVNNGNSAATWTFKFKSVASNGTGSGWNWGVGPGLYITNKTYTANIDSGDILSLWVYAVDSGAAATVGANLNLMLHATNILYPSFTKSMWTNYMGDDGIRYGGDMGNDWTGSPGLYPGEVFIPGLGSPPDGYLVLKITGGGSPVLNITKTAEGISLAGIAAQPIPGATILYSIACSNIGTGAAVNNVIYDMLASDVKYFTNTATNTGGWTVYFSTNAGPGFVYDGAGWVTVEPSPEKVKWIKWQRASLAAGEKYTLKYKVIIK